MLEYESLGSAVINFNSPVRGDSFIGLGKTDELRCKSNSFRQRWSNSFTPEKVTKFFYIHICSTATIRCFCTLLIPMERTSSSKGLEECCSVTFFRYFEPFMTWDILPNTVIQRLLFSEEFDGRTNDDPLKLRRMKSSSSTELSSGMKNRDWKNRLSLRGSRRASTLEEVIRSEQMCSIYPVFEAYKALIKIILKYKLILIVK